MTKIITVPDIHGRSFWQKVKDNTKDIIIFLGDYLDPYLHEYITFETALTNFKEIIEFAKTRENIILLIGNHDYPYFFNVKGYSRYNPKYAYEVHKLFYDNQTLFKIAFMQNNTLFTHAGINKPWCEKYLKFEGTLVENLTKTFYKYPHFFNIAGYSRGGTEPYGSPLWTDFYDFDEEYINNPQLRQIVGHTMGISLRKNISNVYCLDCKKIFVVDDNDVYEY